MKIRIKAKIQTQKGSLSPGDVISVKPEVAKRWIKEKKAVKVKE